MSFFQIGIIYVFIFLCCFLFTLRYKARISKHEGDFPETLVKTFVIFIYVGGLFGLAFSLPTIVSQTRIIAETLGLSSQLAFVENSFFAFLSLLEFK